MEFNTNVLVEISQEEFEARKISEAHAKEVIKTILKVNASRDLQEWKDDVKRVFPECPDLSGKTFEESCKIISTIPGQEDNYDLKDVMSQGSHLCYMGLTHDDIHFLSKKFGIEPSRIIDLEQEIK